MTTSKTYTRADYYQASNDYADAMQSLSICRKGGYHSDKLKDFEQDVIDAKNRKAEIKQYLKDNNIPY